MMTNEQINHLHSDVERAIERVKRTQANPCSSKHRAALLRVKDAREALMAAGNQIERERLAESSYG